MTFNLMIAGVGGQGTVLASKLVAAAAMKKGYNARTTEFIGMAQRGGSVFGHCRIGENIFSPKIPLGKADAIIGFEPAETVRQLPYLKPDGVVIVCDNVIKPVSGPSVGAYEGAVMIDYLKAQTGFANAPKLIIVDGSRFTGQNAKTLNVALLGAAAQSGLFPFDAETLKEVITEVVPKRFWDMNLNAFETGRSIV
ncbi:MAG: indolepyruvate oxidoreductase subunit beta [Treponema sp.]|nr:indolepyruvate oxidoreductase subunit beta [Treponema sp.]